MTRRHRDRAVRTGCDRGTSSRLSEKPPVKVIETGGPPPEKAIGYGLDLGEEIKPHATEVAFEQQALMAAIGDTHRRLRKIFQRQHITRGHAVDSSLRDRGQTEYAKLA